MKTQKKLILAGMAMSLVMATGCKNSSVSAEERVSGSPDPVFAGDVASEEVTLEIAAQLKVKADAAVAKLKESTDLLRDATAYRDDVKDARDAETNLIVREVMSSQVEASVVKVQALEKNVEMATDLVVAERALLTKALESLSSEDQAKLGEADFEFQVGFDNEKARIEMAIEAQRELTLSAEEKVQELNERLVALEENLEKLVAAEGNIPQQIIETERRARGVLLGDLEDANKNLAINMAQEDNLVKLLSEMSL